MTVDDAHSRISYEEATVSHGDPAESCTTTRGQSRDDGATEAVQGQSRPRHTIERGGRPPACAGCAAAERAARAARQSARGAGCRGAAGQGADEGDALPGDAGRCCARADHVAVSGHDVATLCENHGRVAAERGLTISATAVSSAACHLASSTIGSSSASVSSTAVALLPAVNATAAAASLPVTAQGRAPR